MEHHINTEMQRTHVEYHPCAIQTSATECPRPVARSPRSLLPSRIGEFFLFVPVSPSPLITDNTNYCSALTKHEEVYGLRKKQKVKLLRSQTEPVPADSESEQVA